MAKEPKTFPHDDTFPDNVNPTEEAREEWSNNIEKQRKAESDVAAKDEDKRDEAAANLDHEAKLGYGDPSLADKADEKPARQNKTTSK